MRYEGRMQQRRRRVRMAAVGAEHPVLQGVFAEETAAELVDGQF
jgi:hypothetical protein